MSRSVLLSSNYSAWPEAFNSQNWSFLNVVAQIERASLLVPGERRYLKKRSVRPGLDYLLPASLARAISSARAALGMVRLSPMQQTDVEDEHDLFFFSCQFPHELSSLRQLRRWRERSRLAVAYIIESWSPTFDSLRGELRLLDQFDHVFVLNRSCMSNLRRYTSAPISFLPTATDCVMACPSSPERSRPIDVFTYGRRSAALHEMLLEMAADDEDFLYVYDVWLHATVPSFRDARLLNAKLAKASRFFVAYDHTTGGTAPIGRDRALATRYFEGAASGAVMVGTPAECPEFGELFDWPGALVEIPRSPRSRADLDVFLGMDEAQRRRISRENIRQSLLRHDWSHRWKTILTTLGLPPTEAHATREADLARRADVFVAGA